MLKGTGNGMKIFFVFFIIIFTLNLFGIRIFGDYLYSAEGITLAFLYCVSLGMFLKV